MKQKESMKHTHQIIFVLLALLCSNLLASALPGRAEVRKIAGTATRINPAGAASSLAVGAVLGSGDTISTGPGSTVDLWLGLNGDWLRLDPDSILKFDVLDIANISERRVTTTLHLTRGGVTSNVVNKLTAASKYSIRTAAGIAEIRGTTYAFKSDGTLIVATGIVNFTYILDGVSKTVTVTARQQFKPGDAAPEAAKRNDLDKISDAVSTLKDGDGTVTFKGLTVTVTTFENPADVSTSGR